MHGQFQSEMFYASVLKRLREAGFTKQQRDRKRADISLMNDRLVEAMFINNKNNGIITDAANVFRRVYKLPPIPAITSTVTQKSSAGSHYWKRKMIADLLSQSKIPTKKEGILRSIFNLTVEMQSDLQDGFDVRAILSFGNALREDWVMGYGYPQAPDTMGIYILGHNLPRFEYKKEFYTQIVNVDRDYPKKLFLEEKYSNFFVELPKLKKKADWGEELHELWDLCAVFKHKLSEYDEVMDMVTSPVAQSLLMEAQKAAGVDDVIDEALADEEAEKYVSNLLADNRAEIEREAEKRRKEDLRRIVDLIGRGLSPDEALRQIEG